MQCQAGKNDFIVRTLFSIVQNFLLSLDSELDMGISVCAFTLGRGVFFFIDFYIFIVIATYAFVCLYVHILINLNVRASPFICSSG